MTKHFCDMCGVEIINQRDVYELDENDFLVATYVESTSFFGKELCKDCYYKRLSKHISLDLELFNELEEQDG